MYKAARQPKENVRNYAGRRSVMAQWICGGHWLMELLSCGLSEDASMMTVTRFCWFKTVLEWIFVAEVTSLAHGSLFYDKRILITCFAVTDVHRTFHCGAEFMICEEQISCIDFNVFVWFLSLHRWLWYMLSLSMVVCQCPICRHGWSCCMCPMSCACRLLDLPQHFVSVCIISCSSSTVLNVHSVHFPFYEFSIYATKCKNSFLLHITRVTYISLSAPHSGACLIKCCTCYFAVRNCSTRYCFLTLVTSE